MQRFFFDNEVITDGVFIVTGEKHNHISKVLRLSIGEKVVFCDGNDIDYICELMSADSRNSQFTIVEETKNCTEPELKISIFQCLPKGDKLDDTVKRCVQFGAFEIIPVLSKRCVSRPDEKSAEKKVERLKKISRSSAMQSMRGHIPKIGNVVDFKAALSKMTEYDNAFICYEDEKETLINSISVKGESIAVLIGPEGGLDKTEIELARSAGIDSISLGKRILRTEDAAPFLIPILLSMTNNL